MDEIRQNKVSVTYFSDKGDRCVRVINTTMSAEEVKINLPLTAMAIYRGTKKEKL